MKRLGLVALALSAAAAMAAPARAGSQPITTLTPAAPSAPAPAAGSQAPAPSTASPQSPAAPSQSPAAPSQPPAAPSQSPAAPSQSPAAPSQSQAPAAPSRAPAAPAAPSRAPAAPAAPSRAPAAPAPVAPAPAPVATTPAPAPVAATKPASFELVDRGDTVEVIARNIKAARTAILPVRSRLEVPIVGAPSVKRVIPTDPTVKIIELDGTDSPRALSVKLGFERADVRTLSRFAQAIQVGDDLHLLIPRKIPAEGVAPRLPDPTLTAELAAAVARSEPSTVMVGPRPDPSVARKAESKPATTDASNQAGANGNAPPGMQPAPVAAAAPAASTASNASPPPGSHPAPGAALDATGTAADAKPQSASTDVRPGAAAAIAKPAADGKPLKPALASAPDDTWFKIAIYTALGLAAAGAGIWLMRRRRINFTPPASIEIIAQRSLGAKARIVWLSAGPREMIVSVTAQQVRMLGQWRKSDLPASLPAAHTHSNERYAPRSEILDERSESWGRGPAGSAGGEGVRPLSIDERYAPRSEIVDERSESAPRSEIIDERSQSWARSPARGTGDLCGVVDKPMSPAVSGILRLRGRTGQIPAVAPDDVASGDVVADELWAKEILAATGARR